MNHDAYVSQSTEYLIRTNVGKLIATAVVMVWNFLTRKWLLDDTHTNAMNRCAKPTTASRRKSWKPSGRTASRTGSVYGRWSTPPTVGPSSPEFGKSVCTTRKSALIKSALIPDSRRRPDSPEYEKAVLTPIKV